MTYRRRHDRAADARARAATCVREFGPSKTQQSMSVDCDLNVLVKRFGIDKEPLPPAVFDPSFYGDLPDGLDLRTALDRVRDANDRFMRLPAALRAYFHNDPATLWQFVNDPANAEECIRLGLLHRPAAAQPPRDAPPPKAGSGEAASPSPSAT